MAVLGRGCRRLWAARGACCAGSGEVHADRKALDGRVVEWLRRLWNMSVCLHARKWVEAGGHRFGGAESLRCKSASSRWQGNICSGAGWTAVWVCASAHKFMGDKAPSLGGSPGHVCISRGGGLGLAHVPGNAGLHAALHVLLELLLHPQPGLQLHQARGGCHVKCDAGLEAHPSLLRSGLLALLGSAIAPSSTRALRRGTQPRQCPGLQQHQTLHQEVGPLMLTVPRRHS